MTVPFYVSPEQLVRDRSDFARKGIARGRSVVVQRYRDGICFVAENPSGTLHKVSEIHDRIGFAAVGRYNEFESLRVAGIQAADLRGFTYDRADVSARALVQLYARVLGSVFASDDKPLEVELALAEVGDAAASDRLYRIAYDGSVAEEGDLFVMGGAAEALTEQLREGHSPGAGLGEAIALAAAALLAAAEGTPTLEIAVLDRTRASRRKFERLDADRIQELLG